jgi:hypothetical protein
VDIRITLPDRSEHRQRIKCSLSSKSAARHWGVERERQWYEELIAPTPANADLKEVPTLAAFAPRFIEGHARANRQKAGGIAQKEPFYAFTWCRFSDGSGWTPSRLKMFSG